MIRAPWGVSPLWSGFATWSRGDNPRRAGSAGGGGSDGRRRSRLGSSPAGRAA
jgi:hypothetical protein